MRGREEREREKIGEKLGMEGQRREERKISSSSHHTVPVSLCISGPSGFLVCHQVYWTST